MPTSTNGSLPKRIYVLDFHRVSRFYEPWVHDCGAPVVFVQDFHADWEPPADAGLLVSAETYTEPTVSVLRRGVEQDVPVLVLADGMLEYRNSWHNPTQVPGAVFQPVLGHKLACLGANQSRHVESWGNTGLTEVVGFPAFDPLIGLRRHRDPADPFRLLVATAKTPYFDDAQKAIVLTQLRELRAALAAWQRRTTRPTQVLWRLTGDLTVAIGLDETRDTIASEPLRELLPTCDGVICTPSTLMIEAMLVDLPVATLDYFNPPPYVSPAWRITAATQMQATLDELLDPPEPKRRFQRVTLHDALECETPAAPRMIMLVQRMMAIGEECRAQGRPLTFPARILSTPQAPLRAPADPVEPLDESQDASPAIRLELRHLRKALADQHGLIARGMIELREQEARLRSFEGHMAGVEHRTAEMHQEIERGRNALDEREAQLRDYEGHLAGVEHRIGEMQHEIERRRKELDEREAQLRSFEGHLAGVEHRSAETLGEIERRTTELREHEAQLRSFEGHLAGVEHRSAETLSEIERRTTELREHEAQLRSFEGHLAGVEHRSAETLGEIERRTTELREHEAQLRSFEGHLAGVEHRIAGARQEADLSREQAEGQLAQLAERRTTFAAIRHHTVLPLVTSRTRRLLIWGTGRYASTLCERWPALLEGATAFIDSTPARQGSTFLGKPVLAPEVVGTADFVVIASSYSDDIRRLLEAKGLQPMEHYLALEELPPAAL